MKTKKGSVAVPFNPQNMIAVLLFIITFAMVIYILMLPPSDRATLLDQEKNATVGDGEFDTITTLLLREPGTISNVAEDNIIQDIPPFNLYTRTDAKVIQTWDSLDISKSLFEEVSRDVLFEIPDTENTDNLVLSFNTERHEGILTIKLNGVVIYSRDIDTTSPNPISLQSNLLEQENTITFSTSGPGIEFWKKNTYYINNIQIIGDYTDTSSQQYVQKLYLSEEEYANLESFEFKFVADCKDLEVGNLNIFLNKDNYNIFRGNPTCNEKIVVPEVSAHRLRPGENDLMFMTENGNYEIYSIEAIFNMKEATFLPYYFTLSEDQMNKVNSGLAEVNMTILFTEDEDRKKATASINGIKYDVDQYESVYSRRINDFVKVNNNAITIIPNQDALHVLELKVIYAE